MLREYVDAYKLVVGSLQAIEGKLAQLPKIVQQDTVEEKVDGLCVAKEMLKALEALAKKLKKTIATAEATIVVQWVSDPSSTISVRTPWVTATPDIKTSHPQLNRAVQGDVYDTFCREVLGITDTDLIESGAVQIHYKHWETYWSAQQRLGRGLPEALQPVMQEYKNPAVTCRLKGNLLEA